jgi:RNA polymerase sigma-70 factor (ECF subfamily)
VGLHGDLPDEALVLRFREGDRSALGVLVRRHQTALYNFAIRHVRDRTSAEDIVQEAFVRVAQSAAEFKVEARFTTWMYTIVRNLCIDQLRRAAHRRHASLDESRRGADEDGPTLGERTADAAGRADVERSAVGTELRTRIVAAVEELPEEQREVYLLREVSNMKFKEIADMIGIPENTVKSRMRYALERLQEALGEFEDHARALR